MNILVSADFSDAEWAAWWPALTAALPEDTLVRAPAEAGQVEVALVANPPAGALAHLPTLRLIQSLWAGVDRLLADPSIPAQVPLARMVEPSMTRAMAQTALWAVLGLHRGFFDYAAQQQRQEWRQLDQWRADEHRVAVLGLGHMGRATALQLAQVGYRVCGWSSSAVVLSGVPTCCGPEALASVLGQADSVVNLLPLTPATRGLFRQSLFELMKPGANLVNLGRGGHVVEADLIAALDAGRLARAVLDVFQTEPLPAGSTLWVHPQVTVLPHVAASTDPRSASSMVAANVRALRDSKPLAHLVDRTRGY